MDDGIKTLREWLTHSEKLLKNAGVPSPEVDARELVMHALNLSRTALLTRAGEQVDAQDAQKLTALLQRRAERVPLQHLLGEVEWGGVRLKVDARALIPRPETEVLLEKVLELALRAVNGRWSMADGARNTEQPKSREVKDAASRLSTAPSPLSVLDIGTGSGALALGVKKAVPAARVWGSDISVEALTLARENAVLNGLDVEFVTGGLYAGLPGPFGVIVSNPPYLPDADQFGAQPEVQHDPQLALYSGADGLTLAREIVRDAPGHLSPAGVLLLELDPRNVRVLASEMVGWQVEVLPDLTGRERFLVAHLRQT